jgi:hypothetical protein
MIRLHILSGAHAGARYDAFHFPITLGRSDQSDISRNEPGVWPSHCKILWLKEGIVLEVEPDAMASVNGVPIPRAVLRNGDLITLGGATIRFGLSPVRQSRAALLEWLTWTALAALSLGQVAVIYWINRANQ